MMPAIFSLPLLPVCLQFFLGDGAALPGKKLHFLVLSHGRHVLGELFFVAENLMEDFGNGGHSALLFVDYCMKYRVGS